MCFLTKMSLFVLFGSVSKNTSAKENFKDKHGQTFSDFTKFFIHQKGNEAWSMVISNNNGMHNFFTSC